MVPVVLLSMATVPLMDLWVQLDSRLPRGDYRIPSLVATPNGTLLAFIMGRMHRTDDTPNIVYLRRSVDDGNTWGESVAILSDPKNGTRFGGWMIKNDWIFASRKSISTAAS